MAVVGFNDFVPSPRAEVTLTVGPGVDRVTVWQVSDGGQIAVRGAEGIPALGAVFVTDYEVPLGVLVTYRAETFDASGVGTGFVDVGDVTISIDPSTAVFSDPLDPNLSIPVGMELGFAAALTRSRPTTVHKIGYDTVALMGQMGLLEDVALTIYTRPGDEGTWDTLMSTQVIVRTMPPVPLPRVMHVVIPKVTERPVQDSGWSIWDLVGDEVTRSRVAVITPVVTWQQYIEAFPTWADFNAAYATWLVAQQDPPAVA